MNILPSPILPVWAFFLITSISLTLIVWVIQAVNYLEFVSEDGHSFRVYFMYTFSIFRIERCTCNINEFATIL